VPIRAEFLARPVRLIAYPGTQIKKRARWQKVPAAQGKGAIGPAAELAGLPNRNPVAA